MEHDILIDGDGSIQAVYADEIAELFAGEDVTVRRASHVEPWAKRKARGAPLPWGADLRLCGGPILGPFMRRQAALDAEVTWLRAAMARGRLEVE